MASRTIAGAIVAAGWADRLMAGSPAAGRSNPRGRGPARAGTRPRPRRPSRPRDRSSIRRPMRRRKGAARLPDRADTGRRPASDGPIRRRRAEARSTGFSADVAARLDASGSGSSPFRADPEGRSGLGGRPVERGRLDSSSLRRMRCSGARRSPASPATCRCPPP